MRFNILNGDLHLRDRDWLVLLVVGEVMSVENVIFDRLRVLRYGLDVVGPDEPFLIGVLGNGIFYVTVVIVNR